MDGVPMNAEGTTREIRSTRRPSRRAAGRAGGVYREGSAGRGDGLLVTRTVDTGPGGENDPNRALAKIAASRRCAGAALKAGQLRPSLFPPPSEPWLGDVTPVRTRVCISPKSCSIRMIRTARWSFISPWTAKRRRCSIMSSGYPEHRRKTGNGGRLDYRKPFERAARLPYSSAALSCCSIISGSR